MKKTLLLCGAFVLAATTTILAQRTSLIGIQFGVTQSHPLNYSSLIAGGSFDPLYSLGFGTDMRRELTARYYWQAGLHYTRLGQYGNPVSVLQWPSEFVQDANGNLVYTPDPSLPHGLGGRWQLDFIDLQVGFGYYVLNMGKFRVGLMPFAEANFLINPKGSEFLQYDDGEREFGTARELENVQKFNVSAGLAFNAEFLVKERLRLFLSPDLAYQILPVSHSDGSSLNNVHYLSTGLNLGILYRL